MTTKHLAPALMVAAALLLLLPSSARAEAPQQTITVVELFTSQGCSSCPPADALLAQLASARPDVLALAFHVTYWDRLGWKDPYSLPLATERQQHYAGLWGDGSIYTPQLVAGGRYQAIGSDRPAALSALAAAAGVGSSTVSLRLASDPAGVTLDVGAGHGRAMLLLVGFDPSHVTRIGRGENGGRTLTNINVVRSLATAGIWQGDALTLHAPKPPGERTALLLQADDGRVLSAAVLPSN